MQLINTYINNGVENKKTTLWFKHLGKTYVNIFHPKRWECKFEYVEDIHSLDAWLRDGKIYLLTKDEAIQIYNEINKDKTVN